MSEFLLVAVLMLLGMGAYWAMVLFPRQRDFQKRQQMARQLAEGDEVVTYGGMVGRVQRIESEAGIAYLEIAPGVVIRIVVAAMIQRFDAEEIAKNARMGQSDQQGSAIR